MSELKPDKPKEVQDQTHHNQMLKAKDQIIIIFKIEGKLHIIDRETMISVTGFFRSSGVQKSVYFYSAKRRELSTRKSRKNVL